METDKAKARREIEQLTREYLDRGKAIDHIAVVRVAPEQHEWMAKRGIDFTPWHQL
jgi:hypothetical protein